MEATVKPRNGKLVDEISRYVGVDSKEIFSDSLPQDHYIELGSD